MPDSYLLRNSAVRDLQEIWDCTASTWSVDQAETYDRLMQRSFEQVVNLPALGKLFPSRADETRFLFVGSHVVVYRPEPEPLRIVRILHQQSDWRTSLSEGAEE